MIRLEIGKDGEQLNLFPQDVSFNADYIRIRDALGQKRWMNRHTIIKRGRMYVDPIRNIRVYIRGRLE